MSHRRVCTLAPSIIIVEHIEAVMRAEWGILTEQEEGHCDEFFTQLSG